MAIRVVCRECSSELRVRDEYAGEVVPCRDCGARFRVPRRTASRGPRRPQRQPFNATPWIVGGAVLGVVLLVSIVAVVVWRSLGSDGNDASPDSIAAGPDEPFAVGRTELPNFPELGNPSKRLPGGVALHDVDLGWIAQPHDGPGTSMKMRVYVPPGNHPPGSLPCVLVAPAGSNLLVGNDLDGSDYHDETLPYARAGMAVVFYSIDGGISDLETATDAEYARGYERFRAAGAGVVNGRNALEFVLARMPQVDPQRIFCAGHSSAGTLSLLLAAHEPRIKACIAYAPVSDVETRLKDATDSPEMRRLLPGLEDFVQQSSPRTHASRLSCPVYLFHAEDDGNVSVAESRAFEARLTAAGKQATLRTVLRGNHYQSMIDRGIPLAIDWLKGDQGAGGSAQPDPTTVAGNRPSRPFPFPNPGTLRPPIPRPVTPRVSGPVAMFQVLSYRGNADETTAARGALAGIAWARGNEAYYDANSKQVVVPMRAGQFNTGPAKASLLRAGFSIGFTSVVSKGR